MTSKLLQMLQGIISLGTDGEHSLGVSIKKETTNEGDGNGIIPAVILATAAFMAILGSARGSTVDLRLAGMGIPALAHMAAALALAISNNCSLSEKTQRTSMVTVFDKERSSVHLCC